jgi:regulatory protein
MKITGIKQQIKRADRYSIFVDEKYAFSLSEGELIASGVHSGQEVTPKELAAYKETSKLDKVYGAVLRLVARRPRSERELRDYLRCKQYDEAVTQTTIKRLQENGLIDDQAFAKSWVENRRLLKPTSVRKLTLELRQKGIADDIIRAVLDEDETTDTDTLKQLIVRKRRQIKYQDNDKLMQYLARQGFGYDDIKTALADG